METASTYDLWMRVGTYRVAQWVQLDTGARTYLDLDHAVRDEVNLVYPTLDIRYLGWCSAGQITLSAGEHTFPAGSSLIWTGQVPSCRAGSK